jgi:hypothetical protein
MGSPIVVRCACGMGGTRATHRSSIDLLHAKLDRLAGLMDTEPVFARLAQAAGAVERCLADDISAAKVRRMVPASEAAITDGLDRFILNRVGA